VPAQDVQTVARALPPTFVCEAARAGLSAPEVQWDWVGMAAVENVIYFILSVWFFQYMYPRQMDSQTHMVIGWRHYWADPRLRILNAWGLEGTGSRALRLHSARRGLAFRLFRRDVRQMISVSQEERPSAPSY